MPRPPASAITALLLSIVLCTVSQVLLKLALESSTDTSFRSYFSSSILFAALLYAVGTVLWIICLGRIDLGIAYPACALQFLIVFPCGWWLLGEEISIPRLVGSGIIVLGVALLAFDPAHD